MSLIKVSLLVLVGTLQAANLTFTKQTLDDMANYYKPGSVYDPDYFYNNLTSCFDKFNDDLSA